MSCSAKRFALCGDDIVDAHALVALGRTNGVFRCVGCTTSHRVILRSTKHKRYRVPGFFSHLTENTCAHVGGESEEHLHAKFLLKAKKGRYYFNTMKCSTCRNEDRVLTGSARVLIEQRVGDFRCDAIMHDARVHQCVVSDKRLAVLEKQAPAVALEVWHTHETEHAKRIDLVQRGMLFAEFRAADVIAKLDGIKTCTNPGAYHAVGLDNVCCSLQCDVCFLDTTHDRNDWCLYEDWWESLGWANACSLHAVLGQEYLRRDKRRLQALGFAQARDGAEATKKRQKSVYVRGDSRKCSECGKWEPKSIFVTVTDRAEGFLQTVSVCGYCVVACASCGENHTLDHANQYGLCVKCNTR